MLQTAAFSLPPLSSLVSTNKPTYDHTEIFVVRFSQKQSLSLTHPAASFISYITSLPPDQWRA